MLLLRVGTGGGPLGGEDGVVLGLAGEVAALGDATARGGEAWTGQRGTGSGQEMGTVVDADAGWPVRPTPSVKRRRKA